MIVRRNLTCLFVVLAALLCQSVQAADDATEFLEGLRKRGYYDYANIYLDRLRESPQVDAEFKANIPFEQAKILVAEASTTGDLAKQESQLLAAIKKFEAFRANKPDRTVLSEIDAQIGRAYVTLGQGKFNRSKQPGADKAKLQAEAVELFQKALKHLRDSEQIILTELQEIGNKPLPPAAAVMIARRDHLRIKWIESELLQAAVQQKLASSFDPGTDQHKANMAKAATAFEEIYDKHSRRAAGFFARIEQGKCLKAISDHEEAINCFLDLIELTSDSATVLALRSRATREAMESWIALEQYEEALKRAAEVPEGVDRKSPDMLAILYFAAVAAKTQADGIIAKTEAEKKAALLSSAVKYAKTVSKTRGPFQSKARELLVALGQDVADADEGEPTNFRDALARGGMGWSKWQSATRSLKSNKDPSKVDELNKASGDGRTSALKYYRLALMLTDHETSDSEYARVLYFIAMLHWSAEEYPEAIVAAEMLSREFPESNTAKTAGNIAMASWQRMIGQAAKDQDTTFEVGRLARSAVHLADTWPDSAEAGAAVSLLITLAIRDGDTEKALEYLNKIKEDSPQRGQAELKIGQTLWKAYVAELKKPAEKRMPKDEMDALVPQAQQVLTNGIERMAAAGQMSGALVTSVFSLAQLYADVNDPDNAIHWLEDPKVGALTLTQAGHELTKRKNFAMETYKIALRSYISALAKHTGDSKKSEALMAKAEGIMNSLEAHVGTDAEAGTKLTRIYVAMGAQLQKQMRILKQQNDKKGVTALSKAFESFLKRIVDREGNTFNTLSWAALTFFDLGESNDSPNKQTTPKAALGYYEDAARTYEMILENAEADPDWVKTTSSLLGVRMRLAKCNARTGDYEGAMKLLREVLAKKSSALTVQITAAETLMEGAAAGDCKWYVKAIMGEKNAAGKSVVWGWSRMAKITANKEKLAKYHHMAMFRSIEARYLYALCGDPNKKSKMLDITKLSIVGKFRSDPTMGGEEWKMKYEELVIKLQKALNEKPVGFAAFGGAKVAQNN